MYPVKRPDVDLKLEYRKAVEVAMILSLCIHVLVFHLQPDFSSGNSIVRTRAIDIQIEEIPQTEQLSDLPSPPPRPAIPVPTESEDVPEDFTIAATDLSLDLTELPPPPPMQEEGGEQYVFVSYDEAPTPIGGYQAIRANLKYPDAARAAGIEATVIVGILIDRTGTVLKTRILKSSGSQTLGFDDAAIKSVMATKWKPARQRDIPVKVWIAIPIRFQLYTGKPIT